MDNFNGYRSTKGLKNAVVALLVVQIGLRLLLTLFWPAILEVNRYAQRHSFLFEDTVVPQPSFTTSMMALGGAACSFLLAGAFIATAICFLIWLHRSYQNLPALNANSVVST